MTEKLDILIRGARLRGSGDTLVDIGIVDGRIEAIEAGISQPAEFEIDARGNLVTESYVNPHLHLCKVYTLQMMDEANFKDYHGGEMGMAMSAIELAAQVKERYDESWIVPNARRAVALAAMNGSTHIRAFADVDSKARLEGVKALIRAREEFRGIVDLQVVAFAQDGIVREPGAEEWLRKAMALGADVVGGIPWIEYTQPDIERHVKIVFDIAQEYNKDVSMLVDDAGGDPGLRSIEVMCVETIKRNWQGRALAHHARAMSSYPQPYLQKLIALLKQADISVVTNPHTGPVHARVKELHKANVRVCLSQDDVSDAYYPFGRNNMLEVAFLASHLLWMTGAPELEILYDMITHTAANAMGLKDFEVKVGAPANLVVLDVPNVLEALRNHSLPVSVISSGKLIDRGTLSVLAGLASGNGDGHPARNRG